MALVEAKVWTEEVDDVDEKTVGGAVVGMDVDGVDGADGTGKVVEVVGMANVVEVEVRVEVVKAVGMTGVVVGVVRALELEVVGVRKVLVDWGDDIVNGLKQELGGNPRRP